MITLLTIQHDPQGKLLKPLHKVLPLLGDLFQEQYLVTTMDTHGDYMLLPWKVYFMKQQGMAQARCDVIRMALDNKLDDYYFYCDLDRLIYWTKNHPDELRETISQIRDYTVIGRKYLAFQSHPLFQLKTEEVMSLVVKHKAGLDIDVFAGARGFSSQVAKWINQQSTANNAAQDIEWPLIVRENGGIVRYIEVDGLAYESAALKIQHPREDEFDLRMTNLKSVLEFLSG
jgi:hypothetical protein